MPCYGTQSKLLDNAAMFSTAVAKSYEPGNSAAVSPWIVEAAPTAGTPLNLTAVDLSKIHDVSAAHQSFITDYANESTHSKRHVTQQHAFQPPPEGPAFSGPLQSPNHSEPLRVSQLQPKTGSLHTVDPDARASMSTRRPIIKGTHSEGKIANTMPRSNVIARPVAPTAFHGKSIAAVTRYPERINSIVDDALWKAASYVAKSFSEPTALSKAAMAGGVYTSQVVNPGEPAMEMQAATLAQKLFTAQLERTSARVHAVVYSQQLARSLELPVPLAEQPAVAAGDPTSGVSNRPPPRSASSARPPFASTGMYYSKQLANVSDGILAAKKAAEAAAARIRGAGAEEAHFASTASGSAIAARSTPMPHGSSPVPTRESQWTPQEVRHQHQYVQPSPPCTPVQQDKPQAKQLDMSDRVDNGPLTYRQNSFLKSFTTAAPALSAESTNIPLRPTGKSPRSVSAQMAESSERVRLWRASTQRPDESAMQHEYVLALQPEFDDTTSWTLKRELQMADKQTSRAASVVRTSQAIEPGAKKLAPPKRAVDLRNLIHPTVTSKPPTSGPKIVVGDRRERAEAQTDKAEVQSIAQWRSPVRVAEILAPVKMHPIAPYNGTSTATEPFIRSLHTSPTPSSRASSPPSMWMTNTSANASRRGSTSQNSVISATSTMPDKVWVTRVLSEQRPRELGVAPAKPTWSVPQREEYTPARSQPQTPRVTVVPGSRAWISDADVLRGLDALDLESASPSLLFKHAP